MDRDAPLAAQGPTLSTNATRPAQDETSSQATPQNTAQPPAPPPLQVAVRGVKIPGLPVAGWVSMDDRR